MLDLHTGKNNGVGQTIWCSNRCIYIYFLVRESERDANSSIPLTLFSEPDLDGVIPIIIHLALLVNII